jgi:preprotein translocase subunit YajC
LIIAVSVAVPLAVVFVLAVIVISLLIFRRQRQLNERRSLDHVNFADSAHSEEQL